MGSEKVNKMRCIRCGQEIYGAPIEMVVGGMPKGSLQPFHPHCAEQWLEEMSELSDEA
jgi:hypothetical protein